jgi:oligopeptide/dipeptide ABC transporter ATP-binding protein
MDGIGREEILRVRDLHTTFTLRRDLLGRPRETVKAVNGVSLSVCRGEILGLVGESGSGKTTLGRSILRLVPVASGSIVFHGRDIAGLHRRQLRPLRRHMQMIFQDPFASLNPRMTVERIVGTPLAVHDRTADTAARRERVAAMLEMVGLSPGHLGRYPHEFSGGQRQRIGIARALIVRPDFLVADEPVSALDVSIQAQIVNLLLQLKQQLGLTILFIAHDLAVVGQICNRIAVMYLGRLMELADADDLFASPRHPYTEALFSAVPEPDPTRRRARIILTGDMPSPVAPPSGCVFRTRCRYALAACAERVPPLQETTPGHFKACIRDDLDLGGAG